MKPTRAGLKFMGVAAQALLRTISRVAGADIVHDAVAFFQAFEGMEEGFRTRAARVRELLVQDGHRLRAGGLAPARLGRRGRPLRRQAGRVGHVGRPRWWSTGSSPGSPTTPSWRRCRRQAGGATSAAPLDELIDNLRGYTAASDREEQAFADLVAKVAPAPVYRVPLLNTDVHDLDGLGTIADLLFAAAARTAARPGPWATAGER